jgi:hypothetical protein
MEGFCEDGNEHSGPIKTERYCLTKLVTISFWKLILNHGVSESLYRMPCLTDNSMSYMLQSSLIVVGGIQEIHNLRIGYKIHI